MPTEWHSYFTGSTGPERGADPRGRSFRFVLNLCSQLLPLDPGPIPGVLSFGPSDPRLKRPCLSYTALSSDPSLCAQDDVAVLGPAPRVSQAASWDSHRDYAPHLRDILPGLCTLGLTTECVQLAGRAARGPCGDS